MGRARVIRQWRRAAVAPRRGRGQDRPRRKDAPQQPEETSPMSHTATPIHLVEAAGAEAALAALPAPAQAWARLQGFAGALGQIVQIPDADGALSSVLFGWGDGAARARAVPHRQVGRRAARGRLSLGHADGAR
jgi:hypothetical protein